MSGVRSLSQASMLSSRWRIELTFQVAMRMGYGSGGTGPNKTRVSRVYQRAQGYAPGGVYMLEGGQRGPLDMVEIKSSSAELGSAWAGPSTAQADNCR